MMICNRDINRVTDWKESSIVSNDTEPPIYNVRTPSVVRMMIRKVWLHHMVDHLAFELLLFATVSMP